MRRSAKRDDCQHGNGVNEEMWQRQRKRHQSEQNAAEDLGKNHEKLFGFKHFQKRAPKRFQRPRQHNERCPEGNLPVGNAHVRKHNYRGNGEYHEGQPHCEIGGGNPEGGGEAGKIFGHIIYFMLKNPKFQLQIYDI